MDKIIRANFYEAEVINNRLFGRIYNDLSGRFVEGQWVTTSPIVRITDTVIETQNSMYTYTNKPHGGF